jgi:SOS-response transcriptional repressor LexA
MNHVPEVCLPASAPGFTPKQGQYLAFIHAYTLVIGRPPAEADLQRFFPVTPPSVHQMVITLERHGLIRRRPGTARSIEVLVDPGALPPLRPQSRSTRQFFCAEVLGRFRSCRFIIARDPM